MESKSGIAWLNEKTAPHRYRVNVLHRGKERWKYCKGIERARKLQESSTAAGLHSIIFQKINGKYRSI